MRQRLRRHAPVGRTAVGTLSAPGAIDPPREGGLPRPPAVKARDLAGLAAVSGRPTIRLRLAALSAELGFPPPLFFREAVELLEYGANRVILFLDLATCVVDPDLVSLVGAWDALRPGSTVVAFTPLVSRDRELEVVIALSRVLHRCRLHVMTASDFHRPEVWRNLRAEQDRAVLVAELRTDFLAAVRRRGRSLPAELIVLQVLHEAARAPAYAAADEQDGETARKAVWRSLRTAGQLPVSWMLLVFRAVWYAKLHDRSWTTAEIAQFLGFTSPRPLRLTFRRRFGVTLASLNGASYGDALEWAAEQVTSASAFPPHATARALVHTLGTLVRPLSCVVESPVACAASEPE
jgi:AraC-like DNA-binding protein